MTITGHIPVLLVYIVGFGLNEVLMAELGIESDGSKAAYYACLLLLAYLLGSLMDLGRRSRADACQRMDSHAPQQSVFSITEERGGYV